jgi:hypothetical protein
MYREMVGTITARTGITGFIQISIPPSLVSGVGQAVRSDSISKATRSPSRYCSGEATNPHFRGCDGS